MTQPVTYVEMNSPDLAASTAFFREVFGWEPQPFASPDYLVAPHGDGPGVDTALLTSRDGQPRVVPVIRVAELEPAMAAVTSNGGKVVVPPFQISGVGRGCYVVDPTGLLLGVHEYSTT